MRRMETPKLTDSLDIQSSAEYLLAKEFRSKGVLPYLLTTH
jgi:hypothetical protein